MQIPSRTYRCTGQAWGHMGVFEQMAMLEVYKHTDTPKVKTCLPLRKSSKTYLKLIPTPEQLEK